MPRWGYREIQTGIYRIYRIKKQDHLIFLSIKGQFFADILVEDSVVIEIEAVSALLPEYKAQIINYLKATGIDVGLLVNFGNPKLEYRRFHR